MKSLVKLFRILSLITFSLSVLLLLTLNYSELSIDNDEQPPSFSHANSNGAIAVNSSPNGGHNGSNQTIESLFSGFTIENPDRCGRDQSVTLSLLLLIHSAVTHFENRAILRQYMPKEFVHVFLLGQPNDLKLREALRSEQERFSDLVIGDFHDTYRNLTRKHLMGLYWASRNCRQAQFILKLDDDILVNYGALEKFLYERFPVSISDPLVTRAGRRLIAGFEQLNMEVIRNQSSKWFVTADEYKLPHYPNFASGWAYLTTIDTISGLLAAQLVRNTPNPLWIDDVYVTGILRSTSGDIDLLRLNQKFNLDIGLLSEWTGSALDNQWQQWPFLFSNANGDLELLRQALETLRQCQKLGRLCRCCFKGQGQRLRAKWKSQQSPLDTTGTGFARPIRL